MVFAQQAMSQASQWNWVMFAYGFTYFVLIAYSISMAVRIGLSRRKLSERS